MVQEINGSEILGNPMQADHTYKVKLYDFKRPDKFSKEQIRSLSILHEICSNIGKAALSTFTRQEIDMKVALVDQCTYEEFMHSVSNPTVLGVVNMNPLKGMAVLQMSNKLFSVFADRLYGGRGMPMELDRELTEIEEHVAGDIFRRIVGAIAESWQLVLKLEPHLSAVETMTDFCQIVPPTEMIVYIGFDVSVGNTLKDRINFALPFVSIESIVSRLSQQYFYSTVKKNNKITGSSSLKIDELVNDMSIYIVGPELTITELESLSVGDTLQSRSLDAGEAWLRTGEQDVLKLAFEGDPRDKNQYLAVVGGASAVDLTSMVDRVRNEKTEEPPGAVTASLEALGDSVANALAGLKGDIKEITDRQDEMADHLYLSGRDSSTTPVTGARPFGFIGGDDVENLFLFIKHEHPQLCALVLSYLDPKPASRLIGMFEADVQIDLAKRIAAMDRTNPETLDRVEGAIRRKLDQFDENAQYRAGGLESITSILNLTSRGVEKTIIEGLEQSDGALAEEIKKRMFVFEDIVLLDRKVVVKLLARAPLEDFAASMKGVEQQVSDHILDACDESQKKTIVEYKEEAGPMRLIDVEAAQMRIVTTIRMMEEEGEIVVARPDELIL